MKNACSEKQGEDSMWIGKEIDVNSFEAIDSIDTQIDALLDKNERIEMYAKYLPEKPTSNNTLSKVCRQIIENRLIGTQRLHIWLKNQNKTNSQIVIRELFHIFAWRLIKHHSTGDIYNFIRITNKLIQHAEKLQFTELSKYMTAWRDKILQKNLKEIIRIRKEFIQKSKNQKKPVPTSTEISTNIPTDKPDKNQIIDEIVNLLLQLRE